MESNVQGHSDSERSGAAPVQPEPVRRQTPSMPEVDSAHGEQQPAPSTLMLQGDLDLVVSDHGEDQMTVGASLENLGPGELRDVQLWFRSDRRPEKIVEIDRLAPGATLAGESRWVPRCDKAPERFYASATLGDTRWRIEMDGRASVIPPEDSRVNERLPQRLPDDIGQATYVSAYGLFRRAAELDLDEILPPSDYDETRGELRALIAAKLSNPAATHHFLYGDQADRLEPGRFLYHYTSIEKLKLILDSRSLRLGPFESKNDPLEASVWRGQSLMVAASEVGRSPSPDEGNAAERLRDEIDALRRRSLMVSFGRDRVDDTEADEWDTIPLRGYAQPRMWAQYAASHHGACIVIDRLRFEESATATLTEGFADHGDVLYTNRLRDLLGVGTFYEAGRSDDPLSHLSGQGRVQLFAKNSDWANENEYRWVYVPTDPTVREAFVPLADSVVGLVIGDRLDRRSLSAAQAFAHEFQVEANFAQCFWWNPAYFGAVVMPRLDMSMTDTPGH